MTPPVGGGSHPIILSGRREGCPQEWLMGKEVRDRKSWEGCVEGEQGRPKMEKTRLS